MREKFERAVDFTEAELEEIGLNAEARELLFEQLVLPPAAAQQTCCWGWTGSVNKGRAIFYVKGRPKLAYRGLTSLLQYTNLRPKEYICHEGCCLQCKQGLSGFHEVYLLPLEWAICMSPYHHKIGGARSNKLYFYQCGTPIRKRSPSRLMGKINPKSQFREPDAERKIQIMRATFDELGGGRGLIFKLHRAFGKSRDAVAHVVRRMRYLDVAEDPSVALTTEELDAMVVATGYRPKVRTEWPSGDECARTKFPPAMKHAFAVMYARLVKRVAKTELVDYVAQRFGISREAVQNVAYNPTFKSVARTEATKLPAIEKLTLEILEETFSKAGGE